MWATRPHLGSIFEKLLHRKTFLLPAARFLQPTCSKLFLPLLYNLRLSAQTIPVPPWNNLYKSEDFHHGNEEKWPHSLFRYPVQAQHGHRKLLLPEQHHHRHTWTESDCSGMYRLLLFCKAELLRINFIPCKAPLLFLLLHQKQHSPFLWKGEYILLKNTIRSRMIFLFVINSFEKVQQIVQKIEFGILQNRKIPESPCKITKFQV